MDVIVWVRSSGQQRLTIGLTWKGSRLIGICFVDVIGGIGIDSVILGDLIATVWRITELVFVDEVVCA